MVIIQFMYVNRELNKARNCTLGEQRLFIQSKVGDGCMFSQKLRKKYFVTLFLFM